MCSSFFIRQQLGHRESAQALYEVRESWIAEAFATERSSIRPTDYAPVFIAGDAAPQLRSMQWGLLPPWARDRSFARHTFNARAETIAEKSAFRDSYRKRRCLVAASGWHEWNGPPGRKQRHAVATGQPMLLAGLWSEWPGETPAVLTFTLITAAALPSIATLHDRMPLPLAPVLWRDWLFGDAEQLAPLLQPIDPGLRIEPELAPGLF